MLTGKWKSLGDKQKLLKYVRLGYDESISLNKQYKNRKQECDLEDYIVIKQSIFKDVYILQESRKCYKYILTCKYLG